MDIVLIALKVIGSIIGLILLEMVTVTFIPGMKVPEQPLEVAAQPAGEVDTKPPAGREDVSFEVKGTSLSAWLYLPEDVSTQVPCIIMGHGFGGTKNMLLERYAVRYQAAGYAVLAFDYRHFGESGGEPRQLMLLSYQLEDYRAAIQYTRGLEEIDSARIALWGTSASGGYGIVIAAEDSTIACVVAQCPGLDHDASSKMFMKQLGLRHMFRLFFHGQRDMGRSRIGLSPHKIPIVGKPGTVAFFPLADAYDGYSKLASKSFVNQVCARVILRSGGFDPSKAIRNVSRPVLVQICDYDSLAPISPETEIELRQYADVKRYPIGHFDIYTGDHFEKAVSDQLEFFKKNL